MELINTGKFNYPFFRDNSYSFLHIPILNSKTFAYSMFCLQKSKLNMFIFKFIFCLPSTSSPFIWTRYASI